MGVCDFTCFVQRNGQCMGTHSVLKKPMTVREEAIEMLDKKNPTQAEILEAINEDDGDGMCGSAKAIIVYVPKSITREDVLNMAPSAMIKYKSCEDNYSWESLGFSEHEGYLDWLSGDLPKPAQPTKHPEPSCVWGSASDFHYVNFDPFAYECFVLWKHDPMRIPAAFFRDILQSYGLSLADVSPTLDKGELFAAVCKGLIHFKKA